MSQRSCRSRALFAGVVLAGSLAGYGSAAGQGAAASGPTPGKYGKIPITSSSAEARAAYLQGRQLGENLRGHESREFLSKAAAQDPGFALAQYLLALSAPTAKEFFEHLKRAVALAPKASAGERLMILGLEAGANADTRKQREYYEKLVEAYPRDERAHFLLGGSYFGQQDYPRTVREYRRSVELAPNFAPAYNLLGYALRATGDYAEAEKAFEKYIELIPEDPNPYDSYAELLMKMGRFDESIAMYRKALAVDPNFAPSRTGIATNLMFQDKHDDARAEMWNAYEGARNDGERRGALFVTAVTYADEGNFDQAVAALKKEYAVAEKINDAAAMSADAVAIGDVLLESGKPEEALKQYRHALELQERSDLSREVKENARLVYHYNLGRVAARTKDLAGAKQHADAFMKGAAAKKNDAQVRQAHELAGVIALKQKQFDQALAHLAKANLQDPYVLYLTGKAYKGKGEQGKAADMFRQAADHHTLPTLNYAFVRAKAKKMRA